MYLGYKPLGDLVVTRPFQRRLLHGVLAVPLAAALYVGAASASGQTPPASRPVLPADRPKIAAPPMYPIARVENANGVVVYTPEANRVLCQVRIGTTDWLGTRLGVKKTVVGKGVERLYTQRDGLPGDHVENIWADEQSVFALVRTGQDTVTLCELSLTGGENRWHVLVAQISTDTSNYSGNTYNYSPLSNSVTLLAAGSRFVCAPSRVLNTDLPGLYVYDRTQKQMRLVAWDETIRADHSLLQVTFAGMRNDTLLLGTDIGVLEVPLGDGPTTPWRRSLPSRSVLQAAQTPSGDTLYVVASGRERRGNPTPPALFRLDANGITHEMPSPEGEVPVTSSSSIIVRSLFVDAADTLWLLNTIGTNYQREPLQQTEPPLLHWNEKTKTWDKVSLTTPADASVHPPSVYVPPVLTGSQTLPDTVAMQLARSRNGDVDAPDQRFFDSANLRTFALEWILARFPHWLSLNEKNAVSDKLQPYSWRNVEYWRPTPLAVAGESWLMEQNAGRVTVVRVPTQDVPPPIPAPYSSPNGPPILIQAPITSPRARRYEVVLDNAPVRPKVLALVTAREPNAQSVFVLHEAGVGLWTPGETDANRWRALSVSRRVPSSTFLGAALFYAGPSNNLFLADWAQPVLLRYDAAAQKFTPSGIPRPQDGQFLGADASGIYWIKPGGNVFQIPVDENGAAKGG